MKKKKVFIAHNDLALIDQFSGLLARSGIYELEDYVIDGEAFSNIDSFDRYDIVLVKDALTHTTGLYMVKKVLQNTTIMPEVVVILTPFSSGFIRTLCHEMNVLYKNIAVTSAYHLMDILYKYDLTDGYRNKQIFDSQAEIIALLKKCGLIRRYIGYAYFEYIINRMFNESEFINSPMRDIYKKVADHFKVSQGSVEKAMRVCLKVSLIKNGNLYVRMLLGINEKTKEDELPSTSTFIRVCIKTLKEQKSLVMMNSLPKTSVKV